MFDALLGKIDNFLGKDFLFASLLPTLLFLACLCLFMGDVIGFQVILVHYHYNWSTTEKTGLTIGIGLGIIILAYLVYGLRLFFLRLWSGDIPWPYWYFKLGQLHFKKKFLELRNETFRESQWPQVNREFRNDLRTRWDATATRPDIPLNTYKELLFEANRLYKEMGMEKVKELLEKLLDLYSKYNGDGIMLKDIHKVVKEKLRDWAEEEDDELSRKRARLDRQFGEISSIRPTALGNVVESYCSYSYKRYGMEREIFWPHLEHVIPPKMLERIREMRILLDFFLTMATLGVLVTLLSFLVGPWLSFFSIHWYVIGILALMVSYLLYYKMAVFIAIKYGDLIRASYDLFRLELLNKLFQDHPADLETEKNQWQQLSQLLVYSNTANFSIRPRGTGEDEP